MNSAELRVGALAEPYRPGPRVRLDRLYGSFTTVCLTPPNRGPAAERKSMLTKLTDTQIAAMGDIRDEWVAIGRCTDPADRPRAEAAIVAMYASANLAPPRVVWCGSPLSSAVTRSMVDSVGQSVEESVGQSVRQSAAERVRECVAGDAVRTVTKCGQ